MTVLLATIKHYWKFLLILTSICGFIVTASAWVSRVDTHVTQGNEKMREFDQSQQAQARVETKLDAVSGDVKEMKEDINYIRKQLERKQERGTR